MAKAFSATPVSPGVADRLFEHLTEPDHPALVPRSDVLSPPPRIEDQKRTVRADGNLQKGT